MCNQQLHNVANKRRPSRLGVTLIELLAVSAILLMMAGTLATLAMGVQTSSEYQLRQGQSMQHGQVAMQRILRTLDGAYANDVFPGFLVFTETISSQTFPETLVVWNPDGEPAAPSGLPKISELVVYCPNRQAPNELWEIKEPGITRSAPGPTDTATWLTELSNMQSSNTARRVLLTNLLRIASSTDNTSVTSSLRSTLRFDAMLRPSATQWQQYLAGTRTWDSLPWMQGIRSSQSGLRQAWCRVEFQLRPGDTTDDNREAAIPFFGSGAVIYELHKP